MLTALTVVLILVSLIIVHELGHFVAAKLFGVRVEEFGIGYPPRAFLLGTFGGTSYTLNWIPFGGFVRLYGDEGQGQHGVGSLVDSSRWKQAVILVAGVAMNGLCAWGLYATALHLGVPRVIDAPRSGEHARLLVSDIVAASPADAGGIHPGDEITSVTDGNGVMLSDLTPAAMVTYVSEHGGKPLTVSFIHDQVEKQSTVTPANAVIPGAAGRAAIGVSLALVAERSEPWGSAIAEGLTQTGNSLVSVMQSLWGILDTALHGAPNLTGVVGPVGIVKYVGEASQNGIGSVLLLAAIISVNLVVINLIPVPALDGGRLLLVAIESVRRKSVPRFIVQSLNLVGIALILLLMAVVTYHDIAHLFI